MYRSNQAEVEHDMQARPDQVPLPHDEGNAEVEVENADLEFVHEFGGNLGFLETLNAKSLDKQAQKGYAKQQVKQSARKSGSDSDDQGPEAAYERAPRQRLQELQQSSRTAGLPTKNLHGELVYAKTRSSRLHAPGNQVSHGPSCSSVPLHRCTWQLPWLLLIPTTYAFAACENEASTAINRNLDARFSMPHMALVLPV